MSFLESAAKESYGSGVPSIIPSSNVVAASVIIFYDYLLCFDDEVELIWKAKQTWVTGLYIFIRYFSIGIRIIHLFFCSNVFGVLTITPGGCVMWGWWQVTTGQLLWISVEVLLIARVWAYYGRSRTVLFGLITLLFANIATACGLVAFSLKDKNLTPNTQPIFHAGPCIGHSISNKYSSVWILPLSIHCLVILLVLARYLSNRQSVKQTRGPSLLSIFVWDHTWVFVAVLAISIWSIVAWRTPGANGQISLTWNYSVLGYCGTRLILNLRIASRNSEKKDGISSPPTAVRFKASNPSEMEDTTVINSYNTDAQKSVSHGEKGIGVSF